MLPKVTEHLNISFKDYVTKSNVRRKTQAATGEYDKLLTMSKKGNSGGLAASQDLLV